MDLNYTDKNHVDQGVFLAHSLDLAFGKDENNFSLSIDRADHCCEPGSLIYIDKTEYGGVIDEIYVDTENDELRYKGRTWHGILENKILEPDNGEDYLYISGEANEVLSFLIDRMDLSNVFSVSSDDTGIFVDYQFDWYVYGYTGIRNALKSAGMKLMIRWEDGRVLLFAEPIHDYSSDEEFDDSQVNFTVDKNYRPVNHMICAGQGDLSDRAVIHIFTDENGGVQQYSSSNPKQDSDYILDERMKVMTGEDEMEEFYDVPGAEITTNYLTLTEKPSDWEKNCDAYYEYETDENDADGSYKSVRFEEHSIYKLLTSKPANWDSNYNDYYIESTQTESGFSAVTDENVYTILTKVPSDWAQNYENYYYATAQTHQHVKGKEVESYKKQTKKPKDWKKNWGSYYYLYSDGVVTEYRTTEGKQKVEYKLQTKKPSDWSAKRTSYYRKATAQELAKDKSKPKNIYVSVGAKEAWKAKKYYTKYTSQLPPEWNAITRYSKIVKTVAPTWETNKYYRLDNDTPPTWTKNKYYERIDYESAPAFAPGGFFKAVQDRYAVMVADAIKKLEEYWNSDTLHVNLDETDQTYDIGDIVGTYERVTGIECIQKVTKKIVKITGNDISINYEVN